MASAYKWRQLTDLPDNPGALTDGELNSLQRVWQNQKHDLIERGALDEFTQRLRREWAIETGIIEDVYTLDRDVTRTLIEKGIDADWIPHAETHQDSVRVARIIQDQYDALEGMFDFVGGRRLLSTSYVKELHAALLHNVEVYTAVDQFGHAFEKRLVTGDYKTEPNSPTRPNDLLHEYCPPEHVASEMDELVRMNNEHGERGVPPEVEAAWLHHRFSQIHPFADGNGRVARAIASLVFIKADWFPLIIKREDRVRYIEALEQADGGELRPLVDLFVEAQRNALLAATEVAHEVVPISSLEEAVAAARDRLIQRGKLPPPEWLAAKTTAEQLALHSYHQLAEIARQLNATIGIHQKKFVFDATFPEDIVDASAFDEVLRKAGITPDFSEFRRVSLMTLSTDRTDTFAVIFYAIGPRYRGLIGVAAHLQIQGAEPFLVEGGPFQINYAEPSEAAERRFAEWLDRAIVNGINAWRCTL